MEEYVGVSYVYLDIHNQEVNAYRPFFVKLKEKYRVHKILLPLLHRRHLDPSMPKVVFSLSS